MFHTYVLKEYTFSNTHYTLTLRTIFHYSQMKLLETPTTASLTKSDNEKPIIQKYRLTKL